MKGDAIRRKGDSRGTSGDIRTSYIVVENMECFMSSSSSLSAMSNETLKPFGACQAVHVRT